MAGFRQWLFVAFLFTSLPVAAVGFSAPSSTAGQSAKFAPEEIIKFAKSVERAVADKGARVAVVARKGRPASEMP